MNIEKLITKIISENKIDIKNFDEVLKYFQSIKLPPRFELFTDDYNPKQPGIFLIYQNEDRKKFNVFYWNVKSRKVMVMVHTQMFDGPNSNISNKQISLDANFKSKIEKLIFGLHELTKINRTKMGEELMSTI